MHNIKVSKIFIKEFEDIIKNRFSLKNKIIQLRDDLQNEGLSQKIFLKYNITQLKPGYWRVKFVPYRVIIRFDDKTSTIFLEKIFKRKGKSDYKSYE